MTSKHPAARLWLVLLLLTTPLLAACPQGPTTPDPENPKSPRVPSATEK
ncbi:MAG TPA: hypothetical protein VH497_02620 [Vicinamibacterales bacterium]|jgi:hypothetical protein